MTSNVKTSQLREDPKVTSFDQCILKDKIKKIVIDKM